MEKGTAMSTRLRTLVDSLSIVDGVWQEKPNNLGVIERSPIIPARRGRGNLYVLVETVGSFPDHAQIQRQIINVAQEYYRTSRSITTGIRMAIKAVNDYLFEENLNAPRKQRGIAGVTCMVLRDQDAYIGQLGPALLYHVGKEESQRFPKESTWLSSEKLQDVDITEHPPLGLRRHVEPELLHLYMREGDVFILASTSLVKAASDDEIVSAVIHRGVHTLRENLERLAQGRDLSVLIVEVLRADQAPAPEEKARTRPIAEERLSLRARVSSVLRGLFLPAPEEGFEEEEEFEAEEEKERFSLAIDLKGAAESAWRTLTRLGRGLVALLVRMLPEAEPRQRTKPRRGRGVIAAPGDKKWLWLALLIPLLVIVLFALARYQCGRSRQAHLTQLLQAVQDAKASAEASPVAADKRASLRQALTLLDEALQLTPEDERLVVDQQEIQKQLDSINLVFRVFYFGELKEFPDTETAKCQLSTVIVQGIDVYVLDLGTDRVYKYLLNQNRDGLQALEGEPVLLRKGDQRGEAIVDELLDIVWVEAGGERGTSNLLILDKKGHILEYDPSADLKLLPIADSSTWRGPVAAAAYYDNLYVLDPLANRVLKYQPTGTGYDLPALDYFKAEISANVSNAVDMSIDGNVYVLHSDGTISKYLGGADVPFPQSNLDEPLKAPTCIFASGYLEQEGYIYVADAGNQRVVQFNKDGEFVRQLRSREPEYMDELRSLFVDEAAKKLYLVNGSKLYLVNLPE